MSFKILSRAAACGRSYGMRAAFSIVLAAVCAAAGCAADTEDLSGMKAASRDSGPDDLIVPPIDGGQIQCAFHDGRCCGDAIVTMDCSGSECICPGGTWPVADCPICQADASVPQIWCSQLFGNCCSDAVEQFDCTTDPCTCPPGYTTPNCDHCRTPDAG